MRIHDPDPHCSTTYADPYHQNIGTPTVRTVWFCIVNVCRVLRHSQVVYYSYCSISLGECQLGGAAAAAWSASRQPCLLHILLTNQLICFEFFRERREREVAGTRSRSRDRRRSRSRGRRDRRDRYHQTGGILISYTLLLDTGQVRYYIPVLYHQTGGIFYTRLLDR